MGNHLKEQKMQVSRDLLWGMLRNNNAFLYKRKRAQFTKDPLSRNNRHSRANFDLIADSQRLGVSAGEKPLTMNFVVKSTRRTVNGVPKCDRNGKENPKFKNRRTLKNMCYSTGVIHDKNAATRFGACPMLRRRIAKLHRANRRAAKNAAANLKKETQK